jgi:hypothetical protein
MVGELADWVAKADNLAVAASSQVLLVLLLLVVWVFCCMGSLVHSIFLHRKETGGCGFLRICGCSEAVTEFRLIVWFCS